MATLTLIILALSFVITTALPVIDKHPNSDGNITVTEGSNVTLRCVAKNDKPLKYQWMRVSGSLPNSADTSSRGRTLTIYNVTVSDSGQYYCKVINRTNNSINVSSMKVQVTVNSKRKLSITSVSSSNNEGLSITSGNEQVILTCNVTGEDISGVYWERVIGGGQLPSQNNMSSLSNDKRTIVMTISKARPEHSGKYCCVAYNQWGVAKSKKVQVNITIAPPRITRQPTNQVITALQDVMFTCKTKGFEVKYEWKRHRKNGIIGRQSTLTISKATPSDKDQYYCVAMTEGGYAVSDIVTLTVNDNIVITQHPKNTTLSKGNRLSLNVTANGPGSNKFKYQWKKMDDKSFTAMGNDTPNLIIQSIKLSDSGSYYCVITNEWGRMVKSEKATVNVLSLPMVVTIYPNGNGNITVVEGDNITLRCEATGDGKLNYKWIRKPGSLPSSAERSNGRKNLTINNIKVKNSGQYCCEVDNGGDSVSSRVQVIVKSKPSITNNPSDQELSITKTNEQVTMTCKVTGDDLSGVYWERVNKGPIPNRNNISSLSNDKRTLKIIISKARREHSGTYRCVAYSQWGVAQSNSVQVTITIAPPTITGQPTDQMVTALQDVTFTCKAKGFEVSYQWKRHSGHFFNGSHVNNKKQSTLTISEATPLDEDQYYCVAMTKGGYAFSNNVTLTVDDMIVINEDQPRSITLSKGDKLTLHLIAEGPGSDNFTYQWRKVDNDTFPSTTEGENTQNLTIRSVMSSDSGSYYCTVMNVWGKIVKSNIIIVNVLYITTDPDDVITAIGMNVSLTCNATGADNLMYQWMRMDNRNISLQATGVNTRTLTISNVTVGDSGKYNCIVSSDGAIVTSDCGALSVLELSITHTTDTQIRLNWNIPTRCHKRNNFYYTVYIMESKKSIDVIDFNGTYTLDGLRPYTEYSVYVIVGLTDRSQDRIRSMTVTSKTLAGEPVVAPSNLEDRPEEILNTIDYMDVTTYKVYLPVIDNTNGPFSHLYIVVINSKSIGNVNTKRMIASVKDITTKQLIEESKKSSPAYYVAAVVNSTQYLPGYKMSYILGAGGNTTDADGNVFYNRELKEGVSYFFRVFSVDSSSEHEISTTTEPQSIPVAESVSNEDGSSSSSVVGPIVGVLVTLLVLIVVIVLIILLLLYYKNKYLKSDSKDNGTPVSVSDTLMKEKSSEPEKKIEEPEIVSTIQKDEPAIQETSFLESTVVKTSVGQPTTLVIGLPDVNLPEITWKKDAEPVNHPVLPDGSLYIISTDQSDEGEYTVIINRKESTAFENLQLTVVNPQLPNVEKPGHSVIKVEDFTEHVALLKAEKDAKLTEEFELVVANVPFTQHAAKLLCNKSKNRYKNIIPYDHSRVVLSQQDQRTGSDYINASHVDGYGETRAYIAAQGPMNNTINDFWRMIWEQNVYTIVMLTRLVEDAKAKCQQYWPPKGSKVCGDIKITLHKEEQLANYSVRQFFVEQVSGVKSDIRLIYQFHFTAWPDHGVPKYATPLLEFQKKVDKLHKRKNNKPMLVHCSAGVGRSGTFIAIDTEIQHMKKQNVIDVYDTVRKMRFWRNYMVQTLSQYNFIHVALLEHIACGDTSIAAPINNVEEKIDELSKFDPETNKTGFQLQFEKLVRNSSKQTDFMYVAAVSPKNKNKNRCQKLLPPDTSRVIIPQIDGSSDYINFCFIDDYRQTKAFLAGPGPMQSTASDFWTMIWEKKSYAIVMLGQLKENGEEACFKYWPNENRTGEFGKFLVETISEDAWDKDIVKRTFKLTNTKNDDDARTITQLQYMEWSQNTCPDSSALVIDMIEVLERVQRKTGNGPITVHCSDGVGRSGAFCALMVSINRFKAEQMVDVFQTIINMRTQRPGIVANAEQFEFIHQGLINMIKRFSPYSNFTDGTAV